jgi:hypothetical protein
VNKDTDSGKEERRREEKGRERKRKRGGERESINQPTNQQQ